MSCNRGPADPSTATRYKLWSDSAGYCQNPTCLTSLFVHLEATGTVHFAEVAHIIAASEGGPRGDGETEALERGAWTNLILLCANCHTIVDRAEADYPVQLLLDWKGSRLATIESAMGVAAFDSRAEARSAIEGWMIQNRLIHRDRGPDNEYRFDPEAEDARMWRRDMVETIIPNHHAILRIVAANRRHLTAAEKAIIQQYRAHVADLEARHVHGVEGLVSRRFPSEMEDLFA